MELYRAVCPVISGERSTRWFAATRWGTSGAPPAEIRGVVRFLAECSIAKTAALRELDTVLEAGCHLR
jgi:hypothetical protein